jgi:hypothetical protein
LFHYSITQQRFQGLCKNRSLDQDNTDRIEVERKFSLAKRKIGPGLLLIKREDTTRASIVLSIIAMNIDRLAAMLLRFIQFVLNSTLSYGQFECF